MYTIYIKRFTKLKTEVKKALRKKRNFKHLRTLHKRMDSLPEKYKRRVPIEDEWIEDVWNKK